MFVFGHGHHLHSFFERKLVEKSTVNRMMDSPSGEKVHALYLLHALTFDQGENDATQVVKKNMRWTCMVTTTFLLYNFSCS